MMKKWAGICLLCVAAVLVACDMESSDNGRLDGFWHVERVDTLPTGRTCDMSKGNIFWAFQGRLLSLRGGGIDILMRFRHADNTLTVSEPYVDDRTTGDSQLEQVENLTPYGINALEESFQVISLRSGSMVLASDALRLTFRKY